MLELSERYEKLKDKSDDKINRNPEDDVITTNAIAGENFMNPCELWKPKRGVYKLKKGLNEHCINP